MKKLLVLALIAALLMGATGALAEIAKDETVYARLDASGAEESIYVVIHIETPEDGAYTDYGAYTQLTAMVREVAPEIDGETITWTLPADPDGFYAAGVPEKAALPFRFEISYTLDGAPIKPAALSGQSGHVEILLRVVSNPDAAEVFRTRYMAQIQVPLTAACTNVDAPGASGALVGKTRTLSYTVLPGRDAAFTLAFDAQNFAMDGLTITAVPIDLGGMLGFDVDGLIDMAGALDEGAGQLTDGTGKLVEGITTLSDGLTTLATESSALPAGANALQAGLSQALTAIEALPENAAALAAGSKTLTEGATAYIDGAQQALSGTAQLSEGIQSVAEQGPALASAATQLKEGLQPLLAQLPAAQQEMLAAQLTALAEGVTAYTEGISSIAAQAGTLAHGTKQLTENGPGITEGLSTQNQAIETFSTSLATMAKIAKPITSGMTALTDGIQKATDAIAQVAEGAATIPEQAQALADGQAQLLDGLTEALSMLDELPVTSGAEDAPPHSFVSSEHSVRSVQFIFMTEAIQKPAEEVALKEETAPETFWDRLMKLF